MKIYIFTNDKENLVLKSFNPIRGGGWKHHPYRKSTLKLASKRCVTSRPMMNCTYDELVVFLLLKRTHKKIIHLENFYINRIFKFLC